MRLPEQRLGPAADPPTAECPECQGHAECTRFEPGRWGSFTFSCTQCGLEWTDEPDYEPDHDDPR